MDTAYIRQVEQAILTAGAPVVAVNTAPGDCSYEAARLIVLLYGVDIVRDTRIPPGTVTVTTVRDLRQLPTTEEA